MPQVKSDVRKERAARLREVGAKAVTRHLDSLIGQRLDVLVENPNLGARTPTFAEVRLLAPAPVGTVVTVDIVGREGEKVLGRAV